jgi:Extracellular link domain
MNVFAWILIGIVAFVLLWALLMGDLVSTLVLILLAAILVFLLVLFGFVDISATDKELDILFHPAPAQSVEPAVKLTPAPAPQVSGPEVFYVSDNKFTYEEAPYVCKAYNAELATYIQVEQAYNTGAEWCGYGWSAGGIALFPTQQASWEARQVDPDQKKREMCGRPGVNGGHFDPNMKFGVNCYGIKPEQPPQPLVSKENDRMIGMFKDQIDKLVITPFTKSVWSEYNIHNTQTNTHGAAPTPSAEVAVTANVPASAATTTPLPAPVAPTTPAPAIASATPSTAPVGGLATTTTGAPFLSEIQNVFRNIISPIENAFS